MRNGPRLLWACLALCLLLCSASCGQRQEEGAPLGAAQSTVALRAITLGIPPEAGMDALYQQLDALTVPELGCTLRFEFIPWGEERRQINIAIASGEYDFIPGGNFSDYLTMAPKNAFVDMKPYLDAVPQLRAHYRQGGKDVLGAMEIDGRLYGIPQYGEASIDAGEGFFYREDLRVAWGLAPVTDLPTLEAYLYRASQAPEFAGKPLITDNRIWTCLWRMLTKDAYQEIISPTDTPYAVIAIGDPSRVVSRLETPEFRQLLDYIQKWYTDGILEGQLIASTNNEGAKGYELFALGEKPCETNTPLWAINQTWIPKLAAAQPDWVYGFFSYDLDGRVSQYKRSATSATVISISSRSKYPDIAMRLLEKLHTDQRYYDLLVYGVLGTHYYLDEEGVYYDGIPTSALFPGWTGAVDGYMNYPNDRSGNRQWSQAVYQPEMARYDRKNEAAAFHPLDDFVLSTHAIATEVDALAAAWRRHILPLVCGVAPDGMDADLLRGVDALYASGLAEYLAALQAQIDALIDRQEGGH